MKAYILILVSILLTIQTNAMVFPGTDWQSATPESQGVDTATLNQAMTYMQNNFGGSGNRRAVVTRNGYLIWQGTEAGTRQHIYSSTKVFTSSVLGLLVDDGLVNTEALVTTYLPTIDDTYAGYSQMRVWHLATMSAGYDGKTDPDGKCYDHCTCSYSLCKYDLIPATPTYTPGTGWQYRDDNVRKLAEILVKRGGKSLEEQFRTRIASRIGITNWDWMVEDESECVMNGITFNEPTGYCKQGMHISAKDFARFGLLYLNQGNWNGNRVLSQAYITKATTNQVPLSASCKASYCWNGRYGYYWYVNGKDAAGTRPWPNAPASTHWSQGAGETFVVVVPEWDMVIAYMSSSETSVPNGVWDGFFSILKEGIGDAPTSPPSGTATITGALRAWQPVTLSFTGPAASESGNSPNPFLYHRMQVRFTGPNGKTYDVPGFFDGEGNGGGTGNVWRARFTPDQQGTWLYSASFRSGTDAAISTSSSVGNAASFDGATGSFVIQARDASAPGFLSKGRLAYSGEHYLKTLGDNAYWIKGGTDSPENFLAYSGFDNTAASHTYSAHTGQWASGDPDWGSGKGKGIIGAINYLSSKHVNSIYFLPMNIGGDGKDVWPYSGTIDKAGAASNDNLHFDISKLSQWETVFSHAQKKGILLNFVLCEAEEPNKKELDSGELGRERKLFYRELIARFGHYNAVVWNLCEEWDLGYSPGAATVRSWAQYIGTVDPYDHPRTIHNGLTPEFVIGDANFELTSTQYHPGTSNTLYSLTYGDRVEDYRKKSGAAGKRIPINIDEGWSTTSADDQTSTRASWTYKNGAVYNRKNMIWPVYLSGGNIELILDLSNEITMNDFSPFSESWNYMWHARKFIEALPFQEMQPMDSLLTGEASGAYEDGQVFAKAGEVYAVYLPDSNPSGILTVAPGTYSKRWYNPRTGNFEGTTTTVTGPTVNLGNPPASADEDWAILLEKTGTTPSPQPAGSFQATYTMESISSGKVMDSSGAGNDGTVHGAIIASGKTGNGLRFDGSDDVSASISSGSGDFTIAMWVKRERTGVREDLLTRKDVLTNDNDLSLYFSSVGKFTVFMMDGETYKSVASVSTIGTAWTHIAVKRSASAVSLYVNGMKEGSFSFANDVTSDGPLLIGANRASKTGADGARTFQFAGIIDEVRLIPRALSDAEIAQMGPGCHEADNSPCDGRIEINELNSFITRWRNNLGPGLIEVVEAIKIYKAS